MYRPVAASCRAEEGVQEQGLASLTEAFGFLVCPTDLLLRAGVVVSSSLPAKAQTGTAEVVPTAYGDGVQEIVHADGAGDSFLGSSNELIWNTRVMKSLPTSAVVMGRDKCCL